MPRRARYLVPRDLPRRGQILAACVVIAVLAHVLFAQLTLVLGAVFAVTTRATRWRLSWLLVPAIVGLITLASLGMWMAAQTPLQVVLALQLQDITPRRKVVALDRSEAKLAWKRSHRFHTG